MQHSGAAPASPQFSGAAPYQVTMAPMSGAAPPRQQQNFAPNFSAAKPAPAQWNGSAAAPAPAQWNGSAAAPPRPFTTEQPQYAPSGAHHSDRRHHQHHQHAGDDSYNPYELEQISDLTTFPIDIKFTLKAPRAELTERASLPFDALSTEAAKDAFTPTIFTALVDTALKMGSSPDFRNNMDFVNMLIVWVQIVRATTNVTQPSCVRATSPKISWLNVASSTATSEKALCFFSGDVNRRDADQTLPKMNRLVDNSKLHERDLYQKYARYDTSDLLTQQVRVGKDSYGNLHYEVKAKSALYTLFTERRAALNGYDIAAAYAAQSEAARLTSKPPPAYVVGVPGPYVNKLVHLLNTVKQSIRAIDVTKDLQFSLDVVGGASGLESLQGTVLADAPPESKAFQRWQRETAWADVTLRIVYLPKNPLVEMRQKSEMKAIEAHVVQTKWLEPSEIQQMLMS